MRLPSTTSERRLSLSFFLTTAAKKPRTECCCQSVSFMMAATVAPLGSPSIFSTADCLEDEAGGTPEDAGFGATLGADFGRPGILLSVGCFRVGRALRGGFVGLDFDFRMTIWLSWGSTTASCAATDMAPPAERGEGEIDVGRLYAGDSMEQRGGILQATCFVN